MSVESTRATIRRYIDSQHADSSVFADDVIFTTMSTGEETKGREGVSQMLSYVYHVAFDAKAEERNTVIADGKAVYEADFVGRHIGDFAGVPATNKDVRVPLCVVYDLENDLIKRGRVYMEMPVLFRQLGVSA